MEYLAAASASVVELLHSPIVDAPARPQQHVQRC